MTKQPSEKPKLVWICDRSDVKSALTIARRYLSSTFKTRIDPRPDALPDSPEPNTYYLVSHWDISIEVCGDPRVGNYRGSYYSEARTMLVTSPRNVFKMPLARWTFQQDALRLQRLSAGYSPPIFDWTREAVIPLKDIAACSVDIETTEQNTIYMVGIGYIHKDGDILNVVYDMTAEGIEQIEEILSSSLPLITHNGMFDFYQLLRHGFSPRNWAWDTEYAHNAWYAESKKALSFVSSVLLPDFQQWKQTSSSDPYQYNAKDCWYTARIALAQTRLMPDWAISQARKKLSRTVPCLACGIQGLQVDLERLKTEREKAEIEVNRLREQLISLAPSPSLNPNSPAQVKSVLTELGLNPKNTSEDEVLRLSQLTTTPQQRLFLSNLLKYREQFKALTTYYDAPLLDGKLLYSLKVDGTKTDRGASSKSSLYVPRKALSEKKRNYGAQLQNTPNYYRKVLSGPSGFSLLNIDIKQGDAYGTAYISGDHKMIQDLESPQELSNGVRDFYCLKVFENFHLEIDKDHKLRQLQKKICHASGYLMGGKTFLSSCASEISPIFVQEILDEYFPGQTPIRFANTVINDYLSGYNEIRRWWRRTRRQLSLSGSIITPDGWHRICFGDPDDHATLRGAVAHQPQHMTVVPIWECLVWAYYNLQGPDFRVIGQVHDSFMAICKEDKAESYLSQLLEFLNSFSWETTGGTLRYRYDPEIKRYWK